MTPPNGGKRYIEVVDWARFQHYRERSPTWIKNYTALLSNDDYLNLTPQRRALLHGLWLERALANTWLTFDVALLNRKLSLNAKIGDYIALQRAGFIAIRNAKARPGVQT